MRGEPHPRRGQPHRRARCRAHRERARADDPLGVSPRGRLAILVLVAVAAVVALVVVARPTSESTIAPSSPVPVGSSVTGSPTALARTVGPPLPVGSADRRFRDRQLNFEIDLVGSWRYSPDVSIVPGFGKLATARDAFTVRDPVDERELVRRANGAADQFSFSVWAFANPQELDAVVWADRFNVSIGGSFGKV